MMMIRKTLLLLVSLAALCGGQGRAVAQLTDSLGNKVLIPAAERPLARRIDMHTSSRAYRLCYVAAPLIVGGVIMQAYDADFRRLRNGYAKSFDHDYDDYLQYAPAAAMLGLKAFGVQGRSSWGRMLASDAFSAGLMAIAVNSLKYSCRVMRPDGSTRNSFPSGHTATAFMTATMLHKEYGHRSPWYSIGGYTLATVTGVTRQLNNRHWMSDVMVGAGIGILATEIGYLLADLIFKERGLNVSQIMVTYDRYRKPSFVSFDVGLAVVPGRYALPAGSHAAFFSGPSLGVEGAWFASPHWGAGAKAKVANLRVTVNDVAQEDYLEVATATAGPYFSYPFSVRWLVGGNLSGGWAFYKRCDTDFGPMGGRDGFAFGGGDFDHLPCDAEPRGAFLGRV